MPLQSPSKTSRARVSEFAKRDNPKLLVIDIMNRPLNLATALLMAREYGDSMTEGRLREYVKAELEPRFFGAENDPLRSGLALRLNGLVVRSTRS
jgi:hypothetical protein